MAKKKRKNSLSRSERNRQKKLKQQAEEKRKKEEALKAFNEYAEKIEQAEERNRLQASLKPQDRKPPSTVSLSLRLPEPLFLKLDYMATLIGESRSEVLKMALRDFIKRYEHELNPYQDFPF